ncbi:hypothetical protein D2E98_01320 [Mycobacteroides abscessus]|uniref:Uncharacterized protein n=3 Tax=Mycobacteroides TaxID=670516 RepID=A0ABR5LXJ2_9MYCO|nr:hypothetical protein AN913_11095 [Mycobacteroides immunogenum]KRQ24006.1 hypothetical protein AOT87_12025 [Mycobacteroides sp. H003]KRQ42995.1 hypothetical protein AOT92_09720 [Mycobacteroides sp. H101]KRQ57810.1 hypothetical protein AOT90_25415 [Mycobacteroides sp. H079]KRQ80117.1 hypothetical protein AOT93_14665 [Mycobacteroides sp. H110]PVA86532.1 hypothetical protein DDJ47_21610 [Mycobacteroides abscessus]
MGLSMATTTTETNADVPPHAAGRELFDAACEVMQPGKGWEECDRWVRDMWDREAARGITLADVREANEQM